MSIVIDLEQVENLTYTEDEILVEKIHDGDEEALNSLITKYRSFVKAKANRYFLTGGDKEDVFQEGMIGLCKAIRDYRNDKNASFKSFADLCVTRQIITAVKSATRQKHSPLNTYISLYKPIYQGESDETLIEIIPEQNQLDPATILIGLEENKNIKLKIAEVLSKLENRVLALYLNGETYFQISQELDVPIKSIDNALQRIKRKLERYLDSNY